MACPSVCSEHTVRAKDPICPGRTILGSLSVCRQVSLASFLTTRQLVEQVLVKSLILVLRSSGQENVATDVFMHDLAVRTQAGERNGDVLVKFDCHLEEEGTGKFKL